MNPKSLLVLTMVGGSVLVLGIAALAPVGPSPFSNTDRGDAATDRPAAAPAATVPPVARRVDTLDYALLAAIRADEATTVAELAVQRDLEPERIEARIEQFLRGRVVGRDADRRLALTNRGVELLARYEAALREGGFTFDNAFDEDHRPRDVSPLVVQEPGPTPDGMVWIPGGTFRMGDHRGAPDKHPDHVDVIPEHLDERYEHEVSLDGFWMDATEVTNAEFARFVAATGYVTKAERGYTADDFAGQVDPGRLVEGAFDPSSICFNSRFDPSNVDKRDPNWVYQSGIWAVLKGANWRHPEGPDSNIDDRGDHPVVHVSWDDAVAYAEWAGKQLPTEAQWEYAARGGLPGKAYPWGDEPRVDGRWGHNIWQGDFPFANEYDTSRGGDGFLRTSPVKSFPPNGHGLYDTTGNVWEWCADRYRPDYYAFAPQRNPAGPRTSFDPQEPTIPKRVQRGGSFMCSDTYCIGYSVASRMKGEPNTGSFHCGFRCVVPAK